MRMNQFVKPALRRVVKTSKAMLSIIVTASTRLRFGVTHSNMGIRALSFTFRQSGRAMPLVLLLLVALTLTSCLGILECPSEFGTPASRARWCGPGSAGQ